MNPTVTELIMKDCRIAYALADRNLNVLEVGGAQGVFHDGAIGPNDALPDLIPELVGSEEVLTDILTGNLPRFQLEHINRLAPDGSTRYLTITILPYLGDHTEATLLVVAADTSEAGRHAQKIMQQRNELRLLQRSLAEANERLDYLLRHYVPPEVADALMERRLLPQLGGELRQISVLFADVRGSTGLAERLPPKKIVELLNGYLDIASDAIAEVGGTVVQYMGDGVMALFNAPDEQPDHAWRAVRAGLTLQKMVAFHRDQTAPHSPPLRFGVGINSGLAVVGNVGARWRYSYTAIGDTVNVAARICDLARPDEVLIGPVTYEQVRERARITPLAPIRFKGKSHPVSLYRVSALTPGVLERG
ncbi:MAG TPA: adenylate/guanylate cyclase domain-containing protein [Thermoflexia bacterium]|nr:adenylate/guanylate cyclase domain-containing protein [Thermoflexia bacterium]